MKYIWERVQSFHASMRMWQVRDSGLILFYFIFWYWFRCDTYFIYLFCMNKVVHDFHESHLIGIENKVLALSFFSLFNFLYNYHLICLLLT
jgi:hypothetical protein